MAFQREQLRLEGLSPTAILSRGYCLAYDASGNLLGNAQDLAPEASLKLQFVDGLALTKVISVIPGKPSGR